MSLLGNAGLEDHPDGTGNLNAIINGNWQQLEELFNAGAGATLRQDNGTPGNSGTVLTCNKAIFTSDFVGALIRFADGAVATVASVSTTTTAVATVSQNIVAQAFTIYPVTPTQYQGLLRGLVKRHVLGTADTGKVPIYDHTLLRCVLSFTGGTSVTLGQILYGGGANLPPASSADFTWDDSGKILLVTGLIRATKVFHSDFVTVASATGSQTPDFGNANNFRYNVTGNITINAPTNVKVGGMYRIVISQDGTGGRTVTWNAVFVFPNPNLTTAANGANAITCATFIATATNELICIANSDGIEEVKQQIAGIDTLGTTGTVDLDFSRKGWATSSLTGDITFTTSAKGAGRNKLLRVVADGSLRNLTWPSWTPTIGGALPATLAANKTLLVRLSCWGTTDASITSEWGVQP